MNNPLAQIFSMQTDDEDQKHALLPEAQKANLEAAWEYYSAPKSFSPGEICRCRAGLSIMTDEPVVFLYVRPLDPEFDLDMLHIDDAIRRSKWNKIDCIVMRVYDTGGAVFMPFDSGILEKMP